MVQKVRVVFVDDLTGEQFAENDGETIKFALDGVSYEIDLTTANGEALRTILDPYTANARRTGGRSTRLHVARTSTASRNTAGLTRINLDAKDPKKIRAWANTAAGSKAIRDAGLDMPSDRGRINAKIAELFDKAQQQPSEAPQEPQEQATLKVLSSPKLVEPEAPQEAAETVAEEKPARKRAPRKAAAPKDAGPESVASLMTTQGDAGENAPQSEAKPARKRTARRGQLANG
jgi:hypothetical protein